MYWDYTETAWIFRKYAVKYLIVKEYSVYNLLSNTAEKNRIRVCGKRKREEHKCKKC